VRHSGLAPAYLARDPPRRVYGCVYGRSVPPHRSPACRRYGAHPFWRRGAPLGVRVPPQRPQPDHCGSRCGGDRRWVATRPAADYASGCVPCSSPATASFSFSTNPYRSSTDSRATRSASFFLLKNVTARR